MSSFDSLKGFARAATFISLAAGCLFSAAVHATAFTHLKIGAQAPDFHAQGSDGKTHRLSDFAGKLVILEWTNPVCPFTAVKYKNGSMQALQRYAAAQGVVWLSIDTASPEKAGYLNSGAARARLANTQATVTSFLFDRDGNIARSYGAKTTPSFFIVSREGKIAYQGAMDEQVFGDQSAGHEYVKAALSDLAAGRRVETAETQPQGCAVEY